HGPTRRPSFAFGRRPRIGTRRVFPPIARRFRRPRPVRRRHDAVLVFHVHLCSRSEPLPGIPRPVDGPDRLRARQLRAYAARHPPAPRTLIGPGEPAKTVHAAGPADRGGQLLADDRRRRLGNAARRAGPGRRLRIHLGGLHRPVRVPFPPQDATKAMADASFLTNTGRLFSMVAGGWLLEAGGYDAVFLTGAGLAAAGLAAAFFIREPRAGRA